MNKIYKNIDLILFVYLFAIFARGIPSISHLYYFSIPILIVFFVEGIYSFYTEQRISRNLFLFLLFGVWAGLTSLWSPSPTVTITRSLFFFLLVVGTFRMGELLLGNYSKKRLAALIILLNLLIVLPNFISFLLKYPNLPIEGYKYLGFMGFTNHPNKLAQYILLTFPFALFAVFYLSKYKKVKRFNFLILGVLISILNIYLMFLSKSRASMGFLFIFIFVYSLFTFNLKSLAKTTVSVIVGFVLIFSFSADISKSISDFIFKAGNKKILGSREYLIDASYKAALEGGLIGLGYGISSTKFVGENYGDYRHVNYFQREKTVSLFALIEEVGVIGTMIFICALGYILFLNYMILRTAKNDDDFSLCLVSFSYLIALNVYAQIESWWIGIGSVPLPVFFILVGSLSIYLIQRIEIKRVFLLSNSFS